MPDVEHGLPRSGVLLFRCLLILLSLSIGSASAERGPFARVEALLAEGRTDEALAELRRLGDEHEGSSLGYEALYRWNRFERDGAAYLERLAGLAERWGDARAWLDLGHYRYAVGAYDAAAASYERAGRSLRDEAKLECACWRGLSLVAEGKTNAGIDVLLDTARSGKGGRAGTRARFLAAQAYARAGDFGRAAEVVEPLLRGAHDFAAPALLLDAEAEKGRGREDRARARYEEILARYPGSPEAEEAERAMSPGAAAKARGESAPREEAGTRGFFVQVASFGEEENARRFAADQRAKGTGAIEVHRVARDGRTFFQVRIGPFATPDEARTARDNLARSGLPGNIVSGGEDGE